MKSFRQVNVVITSEQHQDILNFWPRALLAMFGCGSESEQKNALIMIASWCGDHAVLPTGGEQVNYICLLPREICCGNNVIT